MPRRPAPTPLRLVTGSLPPRGLPRHTLPSLPRPAFHPPVRLSEGPVPRERASSFTPVPNEPGERAYLTQLSIELLDGATSPTVSSGRHSRSSSESMCSRSSGERSRSSGERSRSVSPESERDVPRVHGPWEKHARAFSLPVDVCTLVAPPRPAAVNPVPVW